MKKLKRLHILMFTTLIFAFFISLPSFVNATSNTEIKNETNKFYVNDLANVLSKKQEEALIQNAEKLERHNGIQLVVTTIESTGEASTEKYSNNMFNQDENGKDSNRILILLVTKDRDIRIEVGKELENMLNDSTSRRIIDVYAKDNLDDEKYYDALISLQEAIISRVGDIDVSDTKFTTYEITVVIILLIMMVFPIIFSILSHIKENSNISFSLDLITPFKKCIKKIKNFSAIRKIKKELALYEPGTPEHSRLTHMLKIYNGEAEEETKMKKIEREYQSKCHDYEYEIKGLNHLIKSLREDLYQKSVAANKADELSTENKELTKQVKELEFALEFEKNKYTFIERKHPRIQFWKDRIEFLNLVRDADYTFDFMNEGEANTDDDDESESSD